MANPDAAREQNDPQEQSEHHCRRKIGLEHDQNVERADHHQEWQQPLGEPAHLLALLHHEH